jgi:putative NADH-flavin reductase
MSEPVAPAPQPSRLYVVTGAGPVGWTVAVQLVAAGHRVRILTRSGSGPAHALVERMAIDVSEPARLAEAFHGATAVFHCIHASRYNAKVWAKELPAAEQNVLAAAGGAGAVVVFPESLYSYSAPERTMTEEGPREAQGGKRGIRTALLKARAASATDTVSVVASDFFGPRVRGAHSGERMVKPVLAGKSLYIRSGPRGRHDRGGGQAAGVEPGMACTHRARPDPARDRGGLRHGGRHPGAASHGDPRLDAAGDGGVFRRHAGSGRDAVPIPATVRDGFRRKPSRPGADADPAARSSRRHRRLVAGPGTVRAAGAFGSA